MSSSEYEALAQLQNEKTKKIEYLQKVLSDFEKGNITDEVKKACPELSQKLTENQKLLYQLDIMKRSSAGIPAKTVTPTRPAKSTKPAPVNIEVFDYGDSIEKRLNAVFSDVVEQLWPHLDLTVVIKEASNKKFGDYQFDSARRIAGLSKLAPGDVAKLVVDNLPKITLIEKVEIVNAFINIFLNKEHISQRITNIFNQGLVLPKVKKVRAIVDFSSPNIAKQMHVGHLRSTIIGESISRLMEYMGFDVLRLNHIGDWGTQFGMLIAHLQDRFPNYATETPPIEDLQAFYKESKKRFDEDSAFKARAYECVVKLQNFDEKIVGAWNLICDVSRKDLNKIYERLDIIVKERGESFYQQRMVDLVAELEKLSLLDVDEGRKIYFPKNCTIPLTIVKSDGGFTYDTSDLATIKQRLFEEKADWLIYVVDSGQSEHFETFFTAAREFGWYDPTVTRVEHVQFGLVLGDDKKKFKTRSGDTVKLIDLLDEGLRRADAKLREKGREKDLTVEEFAKAREAVAYGCVKYVDLSHVRTSDYVFSFDKMLEDKGNTAVYLLYAYARIRSIARNAQISKQQIQDYVKSLGDTLIVFEHERELNLAKQILKFSDCLLNVLNSLQLHKLCDYTYNLATTFHDFYGECYVLHKTADDKVVIDFHRLVLCEVTADVMLQCFKILGLCALEKM